MSRLGWRHRLMLAAAAGPLWLAIGFAQIPFRDGFDVRNHAFSYLSLGPAGWMQITNFVVAGCLLFVGATAIRSTIAGRKGAVAAVLLGAWGTMKAASGIFTVDPSFGYPVGAPLGMPEQVSVHGMVHGVAFSLSVLLWVALLLVLASAFAERGDRNWANRSRLTAIGLFLVPPLSFSPVGALAIYVGVTLGYLVFSSAIVRMVREPARVT